MDDLYPKSIEGFESIGFESLKVILKQKTLSQSGFESVKNGFESLRVFLKQITR